MNGQEFVEYTAGQLAESVEEAWQEEYAEQAKPEDMNDADYYRGLLRFTVEVAVKLMWKVHQRVPA